MQRENFRAFSLIEMVIVITVLVIVAAVTAPLIMRGTEMSQKQYELNKVGSQGRIALARMSRELRMIRSNAASDLTIGANQITFVDVNDETITYQLFGGNLVRNSQTLAEDVTGLAFTYLDANGAVTATVTNVHYVTIAMTIQENNTSMILTNTVFLMNT